MRPSYCARLQNTEGSALVERSVWELSMRTSLAKGRRCAPLRKSKPRCLLASLLVPPLACLTGVTDLSDLPGDRVCDFTASL